MNIDPKLKEELKKRRLREYEIRMFEIQMDIEAGKAVNDEAFVKEREEQLRKLELAYKAVEAM